MLITMIVQVDVVSFEDKWTLAFVCSIGLSFILFASGRFQSFFIFLASIYQTMNFDGVHNWVRTLKKQQSPK